MTSYITYFYALWHTLYNTKLQQTHYNLIYSLWQLKKTKKFKIRKNTSNIFGDCFIIISRKNMYIRRENSLLRSSTFLFYSDKLVWWACRASALPFPQKRNRRRWLAAARIAHGDGVCYPGNRCPGTALFLSTPPPLARFSRQFNQNNVTAVVFLLFFRTQPCSKSWTKENVDFYNYVGTGDFDRHAIQSGKVKEITGSHK